MATFTGTDGPDFWFLNYDQVAGVAVNRGDGRGAEDEFSFFLGGLLAGLTGPLTAGIADDSGPGGFGPNTQFYQLSGGERIWLRNFETYILSDSQDDENQTLTGGSWDESFIHRRGADTIDGGGGDDQLTALFGQIPFDLDVTGGPISLGPEGYQGTFSDSAHSVTFSRIDRFRIVIGDGNDIITTGDLADIVVAGGGVDVIDMKRSAPGTSDQLTINWRDIGAGGITGGVSGAGTLDGNRGVFTGPAGNAMTFDNVEDITLITQSGAGRDGDDDVTFGSGNDRLFVKGGNDVAQGGAGIDIIELEWSGFTVGAITGGVTGAGTIDSHRGTLSDGGSRSLNFDNFARFFLTTGPGNDILTTGDFYDVIRSGPGNDTLDGGGGGDFLEGEGGNDALNGGEGDDTLNGGGRLVDEAGDVHTVGDGGAPDVLTGGAGNDRFIAVRNMGADRVTDFVAGANTDDRVDVSTFSAITSFADVLARATQDGAHTVIDFGNGDTLTLENVLRSSLAPEDFGFVDPTSPPANDAPVAQNASASGNEDAVINGTLAANDTDSSSLSFRLIAQAVHGTVVVNANGSFTYTPAANYFGPDSFTFRANDGALDSQTATVSLTINSVNDAPVASPSSTSGEKNQNQAGQASATDIEGSPLVYARIGAPQHGTLVFNPDGTFVYTPGLDFEGTDSFTFKANDDLADSNVATVTIFVGAINNAPINTLPGTFDLEANLPASLTGLSVADDSGDGVITTTLSVQYGVLTIGSAGGAALTGNGSRSVTLTGTLTEINSAFSADHVVYSAPLDFFGHDILTMTTNDNGHSGTGGPRIDADTIVINLNTYIGGTMQDDSFHAPSGNAKIMTHTGTDTVTFDFALVDATVSYRGNFVIIDGPSSHTVLSGIETFVFTDGTVNNADGDRLVDDLFYYARNHDVWNARVDADWHYHATGWREGRDPSAFFDTSYYLGANSDVKAAGIDPLVHFTQAGWREGRAASLDFDPARYLAAYSDVAAAKIDPLEHFLRHGVEENRLPFATSVPITVEGFDYAYYLLHNPDVAAAGVDPLLHFQTAGWKEGRDPNALFDVSGYLANYSDVAAAGMNPLDHYHQHGWREGRDPSVDFDSSSYLAAYADVAAADHDPLVHYTKFGIHEGRGSFADGVWG